MTITHNLSAMNVQRQFNVVTNDLSKSSEKLSSGYKINRSADDAAGMTISEKMRAQIKGLNKGSHNIQDGMSLIGVADGALETVHSILQRMNELSVQAANDTNTNQDRNALQSEMSQLSDEITRIGKNTTFNNMHILDDAFSGDFDGSVTQLVSCKSADDGYLKEAILAPNGKWYPAAILDFSNITEKNVKLLNNKGFSFNCSMNCNEVFDFTFVTDGTPSSASNLQAGAHHKYIVDISQCKTGDDVLNELFNYVNANPPQNGNSNTPVVPGSVSVSHSNDMYKDGSSIVIYANWNNCSSEYEATHRYPNNDPRSGAIDCTSLTKAVTSQVINEFNIQCSSNSKDNQIIKTYQINSEILDVDDIKLTSNANSSSAIDKVTKAIAKISNYRSELGAYSNRLEYSYNNVTNTSKNTQSAESRIRDTDMASEMVNYSKGNILTQAGTSMLTQANQNSSWVLSLLG